MARVLIVDDEQADRIILGSIIEQQGHEVYFASDGDHAFKIYKSKSLDVVVTDLQMPFVNGLELIKTLGALFPRVPIIAVSGKGPDLLAAAKSLGVIAALGKPVDPHELLEAIAQATPVDGFARERAGELVKLAEELEAGA